METSMAKHPLFANSTPQEQDAATEVMNWSFEAPVALSTVELTLLASLVAIISMNTCCLLARIAASAMLQHSNRLWLCTVTGIRKVLDDQAA